MHSPVTEFRALVRSCELMTVHLQRKGKCLRIIFAVMPVAKMQLFKASSRQIFFTAKKGKSDISLSRFPVSFHL
jgi:hypothetical protein